MAGPMTGPDPMTGVLDARAFLGRLVRLDPAAVVQLVPAGGRCALWAALPWDVLVTRQVDVLLPAGTRAAAALLVELEQPPTGTPPSTGGPSSTGAADPGFRWGLPGSPGEPIEQVPAAEILRLGAAAARTLREVEAGGIGGRAVGLRVLRDTLLDHVPVTVEAQGRRVGVPQRLVQAVVRMGFVPAPADGGTVVTVRVLPGWVGLAGAYGTAWWRRVNRITVTPLR